MYDIPHYRRFLGELVGRVLQHSSHLLARNIFLLRGRTDEGREETGPGLRLEYGAVCGTHTLSGGSEPVPVRQEAQEVVLEAAEA